MARFKSFYPKTAKQALKWIVENEHYEGYHSTRRKTTGLVLRNNTDDCFIPSQLLPEGAIKPSDYEVTKRMYEPDTLGLEILKS